MAVSGNGKAVSLNSESASSPVASSNKKASGKSPVSPTKQDSSLSKASTSSKSSQPVKPTTPKTAKASSNNGSQQKSNPPSSNNGSPKQKSSSPKLNASYKRVISSPDLKNNLEQKLGGGDISSEKKAISKSNRSSNSDLTKSSDLEKITSISSGNIKKTTIGSTSDKTSNPIKTSVTTKSNIDLKESDVVLKTGSLKSGIECSLSKPMDDAEISPNPINILLSEDQKASKNCDIVTQIDSKNCRENQPLKNINKIDSNSPILSNYDQTEVNFIEEGDYVIVQHKEKIDEVTSCSPKELGSCSSVTSSSKDDDGNLISIKNLSTEKTEISEKIPEDLGRKSNLADCNIDTSERNVHVDRLDVSENLANIGSVVDKSNLHVSATSESNLLHDFKNIDSSNILLDNDSVNKVASNDLALNSGAFKLWAICLDASDASNLDSEKGFKPCEQSISNLADLHIDKDVSDFSNCGEVIKEPTYQPDNPSSETNGKPFEDKQFSEENKSADQSIPSSSSSQVSPNPPPEETKQSIRLKVWDLLEKNNFVLFPRPCKGRIPHFVGSPEAADRLATLDQFKKARNIKVNPDKPQAHVRFLTLEAGKTLLVPIPRLRSDLLKKIVPPAGATKEQLKTYVTQQGVYSSGEAIGLDDKLSIDLVVMGAVAVSKQGFRIGKGEGFADLEFAILMKMGAITQDTIVVTSVHDEQVFDTLPRNLFQEYDVPVDYIVTPTNIYEVQPRLPKPSGIFWNILSNRRLELMPILKTLREREILEGKECALKEADSDVEDRPNRPPFRYFRRIPKSYRGGQGRPFNQRNRRPPYENSASGGMRNSRPPMKNGQSRTFSRKPNRSNSAHSNRVQTNNVRRPPVHNTDNTNVMKNHRTNSRRLKVSERTRESGHTDKQTKYFPKPRRLIAFSIRLSGISRGTRVRDLKTALNERGIKPYDISWENSKGNAVLHFSQAEMFKDKEPQLVAEMSSVDVVEGFPAKLEFKLPCNAKIYKYEWLANGKPLKPKGHSKILNRIDGTAGLLIKNVGMKDAGEYVVTIKNKHGEISTKGILNVSAKNKIDSPECEPKFCEEIEEISVDKSNQLLISLSIVGNPVPDVEWSKDGDVLSFTDRLQFSCDGNKVGLKIRFCKDSDAGVYKCKLKNNLGEAETSTKVIVNSLPQANSRISDIAKIVSIQEITTAMEDIVGMLKDLKVKAEGEEEPVNSLSIAKLTPRIESTGISSV